MSSPQIHEVAPEDIYRVLRSRPEGLTDDEAQARLAELGPNTIDVKQKNRWVRILLKNLSNFLTVLLLVSTVLCFVAQEIQPGEGMAVLGWALLGVAVLNVGFAFAQEWRAERAMEALRQILPPKATVRRNGQELELPMADLVPGDVLLLAEGVRTPADARLVNSGGLLVNNAPLTGESRPVPLVAEPQSGRLIDSRNVAFAGSTVLRGEGVAVVFGTGRRTEFGKIASLSEELRRPPSPLELETRRMVHILAFIAVGMGVLFFTYGVIDGRSLWVNLVFMLGIIVANVPEGLLPTFTLALAMGALRLARKNVLVKGLNAVEALGSVQVICTDKTGTLTLNRLAVTDLVDARTGEPLHGPARERLLRAALVASRVRGTPGAFAGDPLDVAIAEAFGDERVGAVLDDVVQHRPFDVHKRRAAGVLRGDGTLTFALKGAWEVVRPALRDLGGGGTPCPATEERLAEADAAIHRLASRGLRILAVAERTLSAVPDEDDPAPERDLTLLGFLCVADPLRPEVPEAVHTCREAGIRVILVTGDHPDTAYAIARQAGIALSDEEQAVLTGDELEGLRQVELMDRLAGGVVIFARTTPEQKMKIVAALKAQELVVGMTGDGVNDAPALKAADVGIAMGQRGTDVAREAAALILLDDNFASIVNGVTEGRTVFANIQKFTNYVLVSNGPEILPYLLYVLLPIPLALTVIEILSIDLGTDIIPSMGLGREKPDPDVMEHPPRLRSERLLSGKLVAHSYGFLGLIEAAWSLFLFFVVLVQGGWTYGHDLPASDPVYRGATGIALSAIMIMQVGNLIGRRSRRGTGFDIGLLTNHLILLGFALELAVSWAVLYFPPVADVMGTGPVSPRIYALAWLGPFIIWAVDYLRKRVAAGLEGRAARQAPARASVPVSE